MDILLGNFQRLPDVKNQIRLPIGNFIISIYQLNYFDDQHYLLLHGKGLIYLLDNLHDLCPIIHKLLGIGVEAAQILTYFYLRRRRVLIKETQVIVGSIPVKVKTQKLLNICPFGFGNTLSSDYSKKM